MNAHRDHETDEVTPEMRALFLAGANEAVDYDVERGLAAHFAAIGGPVGTGAAPRGAPAGAAGAAGAGAAAGAGVAAGSSVAGQGSLSAAVATSKTWLVFVALPLTTAAIAVGLWFGNALQNEPGTAIEAKTAASSAPVATPGSLIKATQVVTPVTEADTSGDQTATPSVAPRTPVRQHAAESRRVAAKPGASRAKSGIVLEETEAAGAPVANFPEPPASAPSATPPEKAVAESPAVVPAQPTAEQRFDEEVQRRKRAVAAQEKQSDLLRLEMDSLAEAKRALGRDPARAFTIARDGERQFGRSVLSEERQHVLILALLELGRFADARRIAAPYLQNHPDSPFAKRVQKALDAAGSRTR
jgi:hypothetical protein